MDDLEILRKRIRREWTVRTQQIVIDDWSLVLWTADVDQALAHFEDDPLDIEPYWAESWDVAVDCAEEVRNRDLRGLSVLDLGCGVGVVGAAAASLGADVWMADSAPPALLFAEHNTWPWRSRVTIQRTDWRSDDLGRRFELIVGSDILYDPLHWPALDRFWKRHLAPGGSVLLGEAGRRSCRGFEAFAMDQGWRVDSRSVPNGRLLELVS